MKVWEYALWLDEHLPTEVGGAQYCLNLYTLCESAQAKTVLEIGTGWGWSATAFAASLENRGGHLMSADPVNRRRDDCNALIDSLTPSVKVEFVKRSEHYGHVDLLYIDADPLEEAVRSDLETYLPRVKAGGLVILDGMFGQPGPTSVARAHGGFVPLQYRADLAHAVMRKEPWPYQAKAQEAECTACDWTGHDGDEEALIRAATEHSKKNWHEVNIGDHLRCLPK